MIEKVRLDAKVTPELAVFIQLDELNGRLSELTDLMEKMTSHGRRRTLKLSVTTTPQRVSFDAIGYGVYNDGTGTVYTDDTPNVDTGGAGLNNNDMESVDLKIRQPVEFWIRTNTGTATVRVRYHA